MNQHSLLATVSKAYTGRPRPAGISNSFHGINAPDQLLTKMNRKIVVMNGTHGLQAKQHVQLHVRD